MRASTICCCCISKCMKKEALQNHYMCNNFMHTVINLCKTVAVQYACILTYSIKSEDFVQSK